MPALSALGNFAHALTTTSKLASFKYALHLLPLKSETRVFLHESCTGSSPVAPTSLFCVEPVALLMGCDRYALRMQTIQQQIGALQVIVAKQQVSVKRQRFAIIALAGIIITGGFIAAVRPAGDATFDSITCKGWNVVDEKGKLRIAAGTTDDGDASVAWLDKDEKRRIMASTHANGQASVAWSDKDEKQRIVATTLVDGNASVMWLDKDEKQRVGAGTTADGSASVVWLDKDEKRRIEAGTRANGQASVVWLDKDEKQRIAAATFASGSASVAWNDKDGKSRIGAGIDADGTVSLPTKDRNPPKKP